MQYHIDPSTHARVFGQPERSETPGRSRRCKSCGDWHSLDRPWPHNCRPPAPPVNPDLATPQVARTWDAFVATHGNQPEEISTRHQRAEYMKRHDLVDHDPDTSPRERWVEKYEAKRDIVADIKRALETDELARPPEWKGERFDHKGSLDAGTEIDPVGIPVADQMIG